MMCPDVYYVYGPNFIPIICVISFFFALKVRLKNLKFEFCQLKLE